MFYHYVRSITPEEYHARRLGRVAEIQRMIAADPACDDPPSMSRAVAILYGLRPALIPDEAARLWNLKRLEGRGVQTCIARRAAAYALRLHGLSYPEIARVLGMESHTGAIHAVKRAKKDLAA